MNERTDIVTTDKETERVTYHSVAEENALCQEWNSAIQDFRRLREEIDRDPFPVLSGSRIGTAYYALAVIDILHPYVLEFWRGDAKYETCLSEAVQGVERKLLLGGLPRHRGDRHTRAGMRDAYHEVLLGLRRTLSNEQQALRHKRNR